MGKFEKPVRAIHEQLSKVKSSNCKNKFKITAWQKMLKLVIEQFERWVKMVKIIVLKICNINLFLFLTCVMLITHFNESGIIN